MALYAIGDLHLSFGCDKPMDIFGGNWFNYINKLNEGFKTLCNDDLCILCGDISWGMSLNESLKDFQYIENLPGKKIILKGNHDYWWTTVTKMRAFLIQNGINSIDFLHNNCYYYDNTAICGTRGWQVDDEMTAAENKKIIAREVLRLRTSLETASMAGNEYTLMCFLHFPPRYGNTVCRDIVSVMDEFNVKSCRYGHLHGSAHHQAVIGAVEGIEYHMISADYLNFEPQLIT